MRLLPKVNLELKWSVFRAACRGACRVPDERRRPDGRHLLDLGSPPATRSTHRSNRHENQRPANRSNRTGRPQT